MYRILLERSAERDLRRLAAEMHERVIAAIRGLAANPRPPGCRKLTGSQNDWRIRVGDDRVVSGEFKRFADEELRAVLTLLAGPGVVWTSPLIPLPVRCGEGESAVGCCSSRSAATPTRRP